MMLHRFAMLLLGSVIVNGAPAGAAELLRIATPFRPPYVVNGGSGFAEGPAIRLVHRLAELAGVEPAIEVVPFERALLDLDRGGTLYPALLRTPAREDRYQWIGEVFTDDAVVFSRKGAPAIRSLGDARQFGAIAALRGSELAASLKSAGLTNVSVATSDTDNARMLAAGRVDAWLVPSLVGQAVWAGLAFDPSALQASGPIMPLSFWVATSLNMNAATVTRLRQAYAEMLASGDFAGIVAPLRETPR